MFVGLSPVVSLCVLLLRINCYCCIVDVCDRNVLLFPAFSPWLLHTGFCVWVFSAPSFLEKKENFDDCYCSRLSFMGTLEFNYSVFSVSWFLSHYTECHPTKKQGFDHFVLFAFSRSKVTRCLVFSWFTGRVYLTQLDLLLYLLSPRNKKDNDHVFKLQILLFWSKSDSDSHGRWFPKLNCVQNVILISTNSGNLILFLNRHSS